MLNKWTAAKKISSVKSPSIQVQKTHGMIVKATYFKQVLKENVKTEFEGTWFYKQDFPNLSGAEDLRRVLQLLLLRSHQGDFEFEGFEESIELVIGGCSISSHHFSGWR